jgi:uncharacterized protein (TIGR03067 family)
MNATLILGVAIGVSAPAIKDPPKKDAGVVGEWVPESMTLGGKKMTTPVGVRYELTADGQWISLVEAMRVGMPASRYYRLDAKADPPTIDIITPSPPEGARSDPTLGIYKVEGDTMTVCYSLGKDRPTKFESPEGSRAMLMVLKRVKKE